MCMKLYVIYLFGVASSNIAIPGKIVVVCINIRTTTRQVQNYYVQNTEHCFFLNFFSCVVCSKD